MAQQRETSAQRERMVADTIEARGITNVDVLQAMRAVPRERFIREDDRAFAYGDYPLSIGWGQTISQPYIVALMTEMLALQAGQRVLEVGTGCGYQTAVLAHLPSVEVYTLEVVPELARCACQRLESMGYRNVHCRPGDGYYGWPEHAPYDGIIVTAAAPQLPQPLVDQLAEGGRLVIPLGPPAGYQTLWRFVRESGKLRGHDWGGVAFVPLTGPGVQRQE